MPNVKKLIIFNHFKSVKNNIMKSCNEQLKEIFKTFGEVLSEESERPHVESKCWGNDLIETLEK